MKNFSVGFSALVVFALSISGMMVLLYAVRMVSNRFTNFDGRFKTYHFILFRLVAYFFRVYIFTSNFTSFLPSTEMLIFVVISVRLSDLFIVWNSSLSK